MIKNCETATASRWVLVLGCQCESCIFHSAWYTCSLYPGGWPPQRVGCPAASHNVLHRLAEKKFLHLINCFCIFWFTKTGGKMLLFASYQHFLNLLIISVTVAGCPSPRPDHSQHTPALQVGDPHHVMISTMSILTIRMSMMSIFTMLNMINC